MAIYKYDALSKVGLKKRGSVLAETTECAFKILMDKQLKPLMIKELHPVFRKVEPEDLLMFFLHVDFQLKCGVTINKAIESFVDFHGNKILKTSLIDILNALQNGESMGNAFERCGRIFDSVIIGLLKSAEVTGKMVEVIDNIISFLSLQTEWKNNVKRAIAYPLFSVFMAMVALIVTVSILGPQVSLLIESLGNVQMPALTKFTIAVLPKISKLICCFMPIIFALFSIMVAVKSGRNMLTTLVLKLPKIGKLITKVCFWQFCKVLNIALRAKLDFLQAMELAIAGVKINNIRQALFSAKNSIVDGYGISESFSNMEFIPSKVLMAIKIGEESNDLPSSFSHVSESQYKEILFDIKEVGQYFGVGLTIITGLIFIFILCSLFYPIYSFVDMAGA